jgi:hypothetical protein
LTITFEVEKTVDEGVLDPRACPFPIGVTCPQVDHELPVECGSERCTLVDPLLLVVSEERAELFEPLVAESVHVTHAAPVAALHAQTRPDLDRPSAQVRSARSDRALSY